MKCSLKLDGFHTDKLGLTLSVGSASFESLP
jgi:hypothetical protein